MYSKDNKALIFHDRNNGMSYGELSKKYGISRSSIQYIVENYVNRSKKRGPKVKIGKADQRRIQTVIKQKYEKNLKCTLPDIVKELDLKVNKSTVSRSLRCLKFEYKRLPKNFQLTYRMRQKRMTAAREFIKASISWNQVIFTDEKMFTVHGSDCYYAWLDKNMSPRRVKQVVRSPGLMIWAMIMPNGLLSYQVMKGRQKSEDYIKILETKAIPIIKLNCKGKFILQHDNCPIHVSKMSTDFLRKSNIRTLDWPPYSPDLNIMENIWGYLSKDIYSKGPIKNLKNLQLKLNEAVCLFNETQNLQVQNLYNSMMTRLCLILEKQGHRLKY